MAGDNRFSAFLAVNGFHVDTTLIWSNKNFLAIPEPG